MDNQNINISEINRNLQESYIHYDPNRIDFTISNHELDLLEQTGNSIWKDACLATFGVGLPTMINGYSSYSKMQEGTVFTTDIFVNLLVGGICIVLAIICFFVWRTNKKSFKKVIEQIKGKPKYRLPGSE